MQPITFGLLTGALSAVLIAPSLSAQENRGGKRGHQRGTKQHQGPDEAQVRRFLKNNPKIAEQLRKAADKNGDGRIDSTELKNADRLAAMDRNGDGVITREEMGHAMDQARSERSLGFIERFDANSYLRIMDAWQSFDLVAEAGVEDMHEVFTASKHQRYMIFTIDSDVCFYPEEQTILARYLKLADVPFRRITVHSDKGHDSFLLEPRLYAPHLTDTLTNDWH